MGRSEIDAFYTDKWLLNNGNAMNEKRKTIKPLERHYSVRHPVATDANSNGTNQIKVEIQFLSETSPICVLRASTGRQQSEHFHHLRKGKWAVQGGSTK